jgi:ADP-L-glycero-D-manno-heptose 6-epimerase
MDNIDFVFHIGARTDTAEFDKAVFDKLNLNYSKAIWKSCSEFKIPLIYASSAATYGMGELGFDDDEEIIPQLKPLNPYGESKNEFDKWVLQQNNYPPYWAGFKFFNVYGPNEYHKNRMASVVYHCFKQIQESGKMKLFRSHHKDFKDGEQLRDFIYVKDLVSVLFHFMLHGSENGIYNLGTGKARSFKDLAKNCFKVMEKEEKIEYIDTPVDIRDKYQYFTEAKMDKLRKAGYTKDFYSLEAGIKDYVGEYLMYQKYY